MQPMPPTEDLSEFDGADAPSVEVVCDQLQVLIANLDALGERIAAAHIQMALDTLRSA
jgi:hypothetical protein